MRSSRWNHARRRPRIARRKVGQSASQPVSRSAGQPVCRSAGLPVCRSAGQPVSQAARLPVGQSAGLPVNRSAGQEACRSCEISCSLTISSVVVRVRPSLALIEPANEPISQDPPDWQTGRPADWLTLSCGFLARRRAFCLPSRPDSVIYECDNVFRNLDEWRFSEKNIRAKQPASPRRRARVLAPCP